METVTDISLFDGQFIETSVPSLPEEAEDFINGFLLGGGEIVDGSCVCSSPFEDYLLWLKDRFADFSIACFIKEKERESRVKNQPRAWVLETARHKELARFMPLWYIRGHKIIMPENFSARMPAVALFLLYLREGSFYEFKGLKHLLITPPYPLSCSKMAGILAAAGITEIKKRPKDVLIEEGGQERFFDHILSCGYSVPRCFHRKFPARFL
jgi:hypothetical protein